MSLSRNTFQLAVGMLAVSCVTACGSSPPMRFYTLQAVEGATSGANLSGAIPLRVERVTVPAELDRQALVQRVAPGQVRISELDRWAAPLDDMIRRAVTTDLASRLGAERVVDAYEPATPEMRRRLFIDVTDLYADSSCAITLRVSWTLQSPNAPDKRASEAIDGPPVASCPAGMAQGVSRALAVLSDRIAAAVTAP
jgi:uncharacterized protein